MPQWHSEQVRSAGASASLGFMLVFMFVLLLVLLAKFERGLGRVGSKQYSDQPAIGGGDGRARPVVLVHERGHLFDPHVRTERAGTRPDHLLHGLDVPRFDPLVQRAGRDVLAGDVARAWALSIPTLRRKPGRDAVQLPGLVVVDLSEPDALEPPRGPRAEVSGGVPAVDDDRPGRIQAGPRFRFDLW